ncbi:CPXCG motif-containing cysteine-rich protein [Chlorobium phaeovibrioides]|uniref:CPXCG motif-containing cysteine-rich protein n=2 Tax=Chlorobium phaeovibrioides TaxID=1094 RepID=A0A3S0L086_CHLPH|nr:CPXCG motif-containing cysteine-rich protein [Chlorobium phaeovibrioides]HCD36219.1 CPXCG motif-containing cysteine-rich protein [Chlorobium sp.]KAA6232329.1 CPXCG motif-containing cysteine-rich protein [Chlorobium phaeovibrioides]MWV54685.1 CPXCG motif-containing cysteine-rich protein [Chlorobium phaeovibrioides]QEQ57163.1 CPXCG motif-containing cysteine-rich protein [Chlorobium phaeovibrioides]RTY34490.1 CPXCG motif-containing cysteine-rich protein [Chlorobium phaeovibrioides]
MNMLETVSVPCPFCGEPMDLEIDCGAGSQEYTEDCPVCCKPVSVSVRISDGGAPLVEVSPEDG